MSDPTLEDLKSIAAKLAPLIDMSAGGVRRQIQVAVNEFSEKEMAAVKALAPDIQRGCQWPFGMPVALRRYRARGEKDVG